MTNPIFQYDQSPRRTIYFEGFYRIMAVMSYLGPTQDFEVKESLLELVD